MRLGPLFRGTFEVQAGNRPLQGQSKPPVFTGGYDRKKFLYFCKNMSKRRKYVKKVDKILWGGYNTNQTEKI